MLTGREVIISISLSKYEDFGDALLGLGRFLDDVYNVKRISLGRLTAMTGAVNAVDSFGSDSVLTILSSIGGRLGHRLPPVFAMDRRSSAETRRVDVLLIVSLGPSRRAVDGS
jgi:hypothetical protein